MYEFLKINEARKVLNDSDKSKKEHLRKKIYARFFLVSSFIRGKWGGVLDCGFWRFSNLDPGYFWT